MTANAARALKGPPPVTEVPPAKVARHPIESVLRATADRLGPRTLQMILRVALGDLRLALCLHRVGEAALEWTMPPAELDQLIELLVGSRSRKSEPWLTLTFDDGYADAVEYVHSRAGRYPQIEWLVFPCPMRAERRQAFHWDTGKPCQLATVQALNALKRLPNVTLGNHTNSHSVQTLLNPTEAEEEYVSSAADFRRLFGESPLHFAFPFGTPQHEFEARHVELLRRLCPTTIIWSTERRPFRGEERRPGAVLPRFSIDSTWSYRQIALWICAHSVRFRLNGTPYRF